MRYGNIHHCHNLLSFTHNTLLKVDSNPSVSSVRWTRGGRYIATTFRHVIPTLGLSDGGLYTCEVNTETVVYWLLIGQYSN